MAIETKKCALPACSCRISINQTYCSAKCIEADGRRPGNKAEEEECECGHDECAACVV